MKLAAAIRVSVGQSVGAGSQGGWRLSRLVGSMWQTQRCSKRGSRCRVAFETPCELAGVASCASISAGAVAAVRCTTRVHHTSAQWPGEQGPGAASEARKEILVKSVRRVGVCAPPDTLSLVPGVRGPDLSWTPPSPVPCHHRTARARGSRSRGAGTRGDPRPQSATRTEPRNHPSTRGTEISRANNIFTFAK